jgi:PAS domain S-box-containing protein
MPDILPQTQTGKYMVDKSRKDDLFFNVPIPSFRIDLDGKITCVNNAFKQLLSVPDEKILDGEAIFQFLKGEQAGQEWIAELISGIDSQSGDLHGVTWHGETIWLESYTFLERNDSGKVFAIAGSWVDISDKMQATQESRRLLEVIRQAPISLMLTNTNGRIYYVNTHFCKVTGYRSDEIIGKNPAMLKSGLHENSFYENLWKTISKGKAWNNVFINKRRNGSLFYEDATVFPMLDSESEIVGYAAVKLDITSQYLMRQELLHNGEILASVFSHMAEGIVRLSRDNRIEMINRALVLELGLDIEKNYKGQYLDMLSEGHAIDFSMILDHLQKEDEILHHVVEDFPRFYKINGRKLINKKGQLSYIISVENISDEKILERQLIEAQKIEALGEIAGGIAHDFNNILAHIQSSAFLLESEAEDIDRKEITDVVRNSVRRGKNITERMLTFVGNDKPEKKTISIARLMDDLAYLVQHSMPKNIHFRYANPPENTFLYADPQHLGQLFLNLILNGADAMPQGGIVDLEIDEPVPAELYQGDGERTPEDYVLFRIKDAGTGIPEDVLPYVFKPFYSTKPSGKGTGLGLSVAKKIIDQHHGWIDISSQEGFGTTVFIGLPLAEMHPSELLPADKGIAAYNENTSFARYNILLIEDEEESRKLLGYVLARTEAKIEFAENGLTALEIFRANPQRFDLIITDLGLPDYRGATLIEKMREVKPSLNVLVMTGYLSPEIFRELKTLGIEDIIKKPFEIDDFLNLVTKKLPKE